MNSSRVPPSRGIPSAYRGQDLASLRNRNLDVILRAIWEHAPCSRTDLAELTGLAPSSITRLIKQLQQSGLVIDVGKGKSTGGRLPTLVAPDPEAGVILSLDLGGSKIRGAIFDAADQLIYSLEEPLRGLGPKIVTSQTLDFTQRTIDQSRIDQNKLLGLGVGVSGRVDIETGEIVESYNLRLKQFPLRQILKEAFHLPVYIENDASVASLAEWYYGAGRGQEDLIYLLISTGIGAGVIIDGQIYRGKAGMPGEIGHIVVDRLGPICLCGRRGCLEAMASRPAMLRNADLILSHGQDPILSSMLDSENSTITLEILAEAALRGSTSVQAIIENAADHIAFAIASIATILNIETVIVGGEVIQELGELFIKKVEAAMTKYRQRDQKLDVIQAELEADAFLKGISMFTLRDVLSAQF
jgi:N-acetylglucosamine repressor